MVIANSLQVTVEKQNLWSSLFLRSCSLCYRSYCYCRVMRPAHQCMGLGTRLIAQYYLISSYLVVILMDPLPPGT